MVRRFAIKKLLRIHGHFIPAILIWFLAPASHAQDAQLAELVAGSDAIVSVEVAFVPYGDLVLVGEVLHGSMNELSSSTELLGPCLPNKALVRELAEQAADGAQARIFQESIERAGYKAVTFLKHEGETSRALCVADSFVTVNWESDPDYATWRDRLQDEIDARGR